MSDAPDPALERLAEIVRSCSESGRQGLVLVDPVIVAERIAAFAEEEMEAREARLRAALIALVETCEAAGWLNNRGSHGVAVIEQARAALAEGKVESDRCPSCSSPSPRLHPAVQHEGEVRLCRDSWHEPIAEPKEEPR